LVVFVNWAWNYINYNNGLRLIIRPFESKKEEEEELFGEEELRP